MNRIKIKILFPAALLFAFSVTAQNPKVLLDESKLTQDEQALCKQFKAMHGKNRYAVFMKLHHVFPQAKIEFIDDVNLRIDENSLDTIVTLKTLITFLGKPDAVRDSGKSFDYILNPPHCSVTFNPNDKGEIIWHGFSNCSGKIQGKKKEE